MEYIFLLDFDRTINYKEKNHVKDILKRYGASISFSLNKKVL